AFWSPDPSIVTDPSNDTSIVVLPPTPGDYDYQFNIVDDFGCSYDTTLTIHVLDTLIDVTVSEDSVFCLSDSITVWANATGTVSPFDFAWENGQLADTTLNDTTYFNATENGTHYYTVTVSDQCGFSVVDSAILHINQTLAIDT